MMYKEDLDGLQGGMPGCTEVHGPLCLHSKCHNGEPTWAWYEGGMIKIRCATCNALVVEVAVASHFDREEIGHA